jgi:predicted DNA-binding transcriptional regulator AlpA
MPYKLMRPSEIIDMFAISIATFYRMVEDGILPRPIPIDRASFRVAREQSAAAGCGDA